MRGLPPFLIHLVENHMLNRCACAYLQCTSSKWSRDQGQFCSEYQLCSREALVAYKSGHGHPWTPGAPALKFRLYIGLYLLRPGFFQTTLRHITKGGQHPVPDSLWSQWGERERKSVICKGQDRKQWLASVLIPGTS